MAASVGVGPEVVAFVEPEGYLVTRFIEGSPIPPERMRTPDLIARAAAALGAVHRRTPSPGGSTPIAWSRSTGDTAAERGVADPGDVAWAHGRRRPHPERRADRRPSSRVTTTC